MGEPMLTLSGKVIAIVPYEECQLRQRIRAAHS